MEEKLDKILEELSKTQIDIAKIKVHIENEKEELDEIKSKTEDNEKAIQSIKAITKFITIAAPIGISTAVAFIKYF